MVLCVVSAAMGPSSVTVAVAWLRAAEQANSQGWEGGREELTLWARFSRQVSTISKNESRHTPASVTGMSGRGGGRLGGGVGRSGAAESAVACIQDGCEFFVFFLLGWGRLCRWLPASGVVGSFVFDCFQAGRGGAAVSAVVSFATAITITVPCPALAIAITVA